MNTIIEQLSNTVLSGGRVNAAEAVQLAAAGLRSPFYFLAAANEVREHFKGKAVNLCGIVNAKSGRCGEDCRFCAQSGHYQTGTPVYPLISPAQIVENAKQARDAGAHMFGIVTSGTRISSKTEWDAIFSAIEGISDLGIKACASLGMIDRQRAAELKEAGLYRYHHNLETARSFFPEICTTHEYDEDIRSVEAARAAGLSTCSGGIIGLGESMEQRIELALTLRELEVDSVPLNILNPIAGTPLQNATQLTPLEILVTIAIFRFILCDKDIKLCGGKEKNLRQLLPLGLIAGCNSLMTGNYLTTTGRDTALDREMIGDLGMEAVLEEH